MWAAIVGFFGRIFGVIVGRWITRDDAKKDAVVVIGAEVAEKDRRKANEIRDSVDRARLGGGLHSGTDDPRGYRD